MKHGDYRETLEGETWDACIVDAPYSAKTHAGHDHVLRETNEMRDGQDRRSISYGCFSPDDVRAFVRFVAPRTRGWFVSITDTDLAPVWGDALEDAGLFSFSPLAFLHPGSRVRMTGDGPAQWSVWIVVARPRREPYSKWGALPGGYVMPKDAQWEPKREIGGKPEWLMRELVKHYSRPGDLICDPCAGWSTTGVAALKEGRKFIGSEIRQEAFDKSIARLSKPIQTGLFVPQARAEQTTMGDL